MRSLDSLIVVLYFLCTLIVVSMVTVSMTAALYTDSFVSMAALTLRHRLSVSHSPVPHCSEQGNAEGKVSLVWPDVFPGKGEECLVTIARFP